MAKPAAAVPPDKLPRYESQWQREKYKAWNKAKRCEAHGRVQPEYVEVPDSLLAATRELKKFFDASYIYVASLKPKPTSRKK